MLRSARLPFLFLLAGCTSPDGIMTTASPPPPPAPGIDPLPDHPIDRIVVPKIKAAGYSPRTASGAEICRRMSIDLIGRIPSVDELGACEIQPIGAMAEAFMAMPEYERTQRRAWGERVPYDISPTWYGFAAEMDALAGRLFREEIGYSDFTASLLIHPGFYSRHQGDDWAASIFEVFLGRRARADEIAGLRPLSAIFSSRPFCDGAVLYNIRTLDPDPDGDRCDEVGDEFAANFCYCTTGDGQLGCSSSALGAPIDLGGGPCPNPGDPDAEENLLRIAESGLGERRACPDGTLGCPDRSILDEDTLGPNLSPLPAISDADRKRLLAIGGALAARPDFWEAAADRELVRFLGWWQSGFRRPDYDVPEVRTLLADELRRANSIRALHRTIVTSILYIAAADATSEMMDKAPPFATGPSKLLAAESWLDSAAAAVGESLGTCDFRFVSAEDNTEILADPTLLEASESTLPDAFPPERYLAEARALGGCSADRIRPRISSLGLVYAQRSLASELCARGRQVLPDRFDPADPSDVVLRDAAAQVIRSTLSRSASDADLDTFVGEMKDCLAQGSDGCEDGEQALRWLCTRLVDSAEFAIY
jgi:hypothetical protein